MNYKSIHDALIARAYQRIYDKTIHQNHHIIPRHENPTSNEVVALTFKEHRIVHFLRYKMGFGIGNYKAYLLMRGLPDIETHLLVSSAAGKIGGATTKLNKSGIFSDSWDRSTETKRRHDDGIEVEYQRTQEKRQTTNGGLMVI